MTFSISRDGDRSASRSHRSSSRSAPWFPGPNPARRDRTQAYANISYGPRGLALLKDGQSAEQVVELLTGSTERDQRQIGVVDAAGDAASFTAPSASTGPADRSRGIRGSGQHPLRARRGRCDGRAFERNAGDLAGRLVSALAAGDGSGGDRRGRQSAAVLVVAPSGGYGGTTDVVVDLRVDDHKNPVRELSRLLEIHRMLFTKPTEDDLVPITAYVRKEITAALVATGYAKKKATPGDLQSAGTVRGWENLEERLVEGARIDRHVLAALRDGAARSRR